jgi:Carboxypeptidase regulatory-like domain
MKMLILFFRQPVAFAILSTFLGCVVGDGLVRVKGHVYDQIGKPLKGALVTVERKDSKFTAVSNDDGSFAISKVVAPGRHDYEFGVVVAGTGLTMRKFVPSNQIRATSHCYHKKLLEPARQIVL